MTVPLDVTTSQAEAVLVVVELVLVVELEPQAKMKKQIEKRRQDRTTGIIPPAVVFMCLALFGRDDKVFVPVVILNGVKNLVEIFMGSFPAKNRGGSG